MTSIDLQQARRFKWKKFATEGAGRLIIFLVGSLILWYLISAFLIDRPERYVREFCEAGADPNATCHRLWPSYCRRPTCSTKARC